MALFSTWLRLFRYVAMMTAVEYEKCASIHTLWFDRFAYTIHLSTLLFPQFELEQPTK